MKEGLRKADLEAEITASASRLLKHLEVSFSADRFAGDPALATYETDEDLLRIGVWKTAPLFRLVAKGLTAMGRKTPVKAHVFEAIVIKPEMFEEVQYLSSLEKVEGQRSGHGLIIWTGTDGDVLRAEAYKTVIYLSALSRGYEFRREEPSFLPADQVAEELAWWNGVLVEQEKLTTLTRFYSFASKKGEDERDETFSWWPQAEHLGL